MLCVTVLADNVRQAQHKVYDMVRAIHFDGMQFRTDIGVVGELKSVPYVEMTRHVMGGFGVDVAGTKVAAQRYRAEAFAVEPDASSACYFFAAAAITGGTVRIEGTGVDAVTTPNIADPVAFVRAIQTAKEHVASLRSV